jgi:hypothetical protein
VVYVEQIYRCGLPLLCSSRLSNKTMAFSLSNIEMIHFPGKHLMGVIKCHQLTPLNKMMQLNPSAGPEKIG